VEYAYPIQFDAKEVILGLRFIAKDVQYACGRCKWADKGGINRFAGSRWRGCDDPRAGFSHRKDFDEHT